MIVYDIMAKLTVLDELKIKGGGLYCWLAWEKLDSDNKAIFKVGFTDSFKKRVDQVHSYFPLGVYFIAFLQTPTSKRYKRKGSQRFMKTLNEYYIEVEKALIGLLIENGAMQIYSTTRIRNQGATEYFYTNYEMIQKSFMELKKKYGGKLSLFFPDNINKTAEDLEKKCFSRKSKRLNKTQKCYRAEIFIPLSKDKRK